MSDQVNKASTEPGEHGAPARLVGTEEGRATARKLFAHAQIAETKRNYEYAIELYVQGLAYWPDAIDEGLKKLRVVATARKQQGGRGPGFLTKRKFPTNGKRIEDSLNNALYLFGLDPGDPSAMEEILQLASRAHCDGVAQWISPVLAEAYDSAGRLSAARYQAACEAMLRSAKVAIEFENDAGAMEILRANVAVAQIWARHYPDSHDPPRAVSNASGELAIVKGRFAKAEGFTESLKDAAGQRDLQDRDRRVHTADRNQELIESARRDWEANRNTPNKLLALTELLARTETDAGEDEAMRLLREEYASSRNYLFKHKADEIEVRRMRRLLRSLQARREAEPGHADLAELIRRQRGAIVAREIEILEERQRQYPSDLKVKFHLAQRYFDAGQFDDAIPLFQHAGADARVRSESRLFLGRAFLEKGFHEQATGVLRKGLEELETRSGSVALELTYWLGRALEAGGDAAGARKAYGSLIQLEYNHRDARIRLERLVSG